MHERSARLLDLISAGHDYADDARRLEWIIEAATPIPIESILDVGCGTGNHLAALRVRFAVEGLDLDPSVLMVARRRLPGVRLHQADMTAFDLGHRFDAVLCLGSAIGYARTLPTLRRTVAGFARHVKPGGVVLVSPWVYPEEWIDGHLGAEFVDLPAIKVAQFAVSGRNGRMSTLDFHYLVAEAGTVETFSERHELGLFTDAEYRAAFTAAGLAVSWLPGALADSGLYAGVLPLPPDAPPVE
jgi:SAM-dependent methyltransferase